MKRTPLKRKTPLRTRRRSAYKDRPRDTEYMLWVRRQPCAARELSPCDGNVQADHAGRRSVGRKADDSTCIPLCAKHHTQRSSFAGPFRMWNQSGMREWLEKTIAATQRDWTRRWRAHHV